MVFFPPCLSPLTVKKRMGVVRVLKCGDGESAGGEGAFDKQERSKGVCVCLRCI